MLRIENLDVPIFAYQFTHLEEDLPQLTIKTTHQSTAIPNALKVFYSDKKLIEGIADYQIIDPYYAEITIRPKIDNIPEFQVNAPIKLFESDNLFGTGLMLHYTQGSINHVNRYAGKNTLQIRDIFDYKATKPQPITLNAKIKTNWREHVINFITLNKTIITLSGEHLKTTWPKQLPRQSGYFLLESSLVEKTSSEIVINGITYKQTTFDATIKIMVNIECMHEETCHIKIGSGMKQKYLELSVTNNDATPDDYFFDDSKIRYINKAVKDYYHTLTYNNLFEFVIPFEATHLDLSLDYDVLMPNLAGEPGRNCQPDQSKNDRNRGKLIGYSFDGEKTKLQIKSYEKLPDTLSYTTENSQHRTITHFVEDFRIINEADAQKHNIKNAQVTPTVLILKLADLSKSRTIYKNININSC